MTTQEKKPMKLSTICLRCKKPAVTFSTDDDIPYTNYSYCEDCLRKGLKLLKAQEEPKQPENGSELFGDAEKLGDKTADDLISKRDVFEMLKRECSSIVEDFLKDKINSLPSAQPEIIHCKDCRYYQDNNGGYPHMNCKWDANETPDADDFCSGAERRTDD